MTFSKSGLPRHKKVEANEVLAGGVISSVKAGTLTDKKDASVRHIVVKHTNRKVVGGPHFSYTDNELIEKAPKTHKLDIDILYLLQNDKHVHVPQIHHANKRHNLKVMADFRKHGFELMQELLVRNELPLESAKAYGVSLGYLQLRLTSPKFAKVKPVENSLLQIRERLQEIHILSYDNLERYRELEGKFLTDDGLIYTDGHPKNIAVNPTGDVVLFDFGRVIRGSLQYPAPNFAAHIGLAMLSGCVTAEFGSRYISDFLQAYKKLIPVEEEWFIKFFVTEVLHRGLAMRWIDRRIAGNTNPSKLKLASHMLYLNAFDSKSHPQTVSELLELVIDIAQAVKANKLLIK